MKITKFYIDKAFYKAGDQSGHEFLIEIDYWNNTFKTYPKNRTLEAVAKDFLRRKHKVNFAGKLIK